MRASFGRKLLAWLIDLWVYIGFAPIAMTQFGYASHESPILLVAGFFLLRVFLEKAFTTPGLLAMAIDIHDRVPFHIAQREDSITIGLAVVTILAGFQTMALAFDSPAAFPLFGAVFPDPLFAVILFSISILIVVAGYFVSHLMMLGWWMITFMLAIWMLSVTTGWDAWHELVVDTVRIKREAMGLHLRANEAEVLPAVARWVLVTPAAILLLLLIGTRRQFKRFERVENEDAATI